MLQTHRPEWPIVGRRAVVERVVSIVRDPRQAGAELVGAAGVGKSSIAGRCADVLRADGATVAWISGSPVLADVPYGAFAPLVARHTSSALSDVDVFSLLVSDVGTATAGTRPVLVADDVQWLDSDSARLLAQLADDRAIGLLQTRRSAALDEAISSEGLTPIEIDTFDRPTFDAVVLAALPGAVDPELLDATWDMTGGVALHVREFITAAQRAGSITHDGVWWAYDPSRFDVGGSLQDVLEGRLAALDGDVRHALELVAIGDPLPVSQLRAAAGDGLIDRVRASGLLSLGADSPGDADSARATISHPLYAEILRSLAGPLGRRRALGELIASFPAVATPTDHDFSRLGGWMLEVGTLDGDEATRLAQRALASTDLVMAERLARHALARHPSHAAWMVVGQACLRQGQTDAAAEALARARELASDDLEAMAALSMQISVVSTGRDDAQALLDDAVRLAENSESVDLTWAEMQVAWGFLGACRPGDALAIAGAYWADREHFHGDVGELAFMMWLASIACGIVRTLPEYEAHLRGAEGLFANETSLILDGVMATALVQQGELDAAREKIAVARSGAGAADAFPTFWIALAAGQAAVELGDLDTAAVQFRLARKHAGGRSVYSLYVAVGLVEVGVLKGDAALEHTGRAMLDDWKAQPRAVPGGIARTDALSMALLGEPVAARAARLRAALPVLVATGQSHYEAEIYDELAFLGAVTADEAARSVAVTLDFGGRGRQALSDLAVAVSGRDPAAAADAARRLEALDLRWAAAQAFETAARTARGRTQRRLADDLARHAHELGSACGVRVELTPPPPAFLALAPRERAATHLFANGIGPTAIATRLGIGSTRAGNLLDRACDKTGCRGRSDLVDLWISEWGGPARPG